MKSIKPIYCDTCGEDYRLGIGEDNVWYILCNTCTTANHLTDVFKFTYEEVHCDMDSNE